MSGAKPDTETTLEEGDPGDERATPRVHFPKGYSLKIIRKRQERICIYRSDIYAGLGKVNAHN